MPLKFNIKKNYLQKLYAQIKPFSRLFRPGLGLLFPGSMCVPSVDPVGPSNGSAWREDHSKDHHDAEQDEGA